MPRPPSAPFTPPGRFDSLLNFNSVQDAKADPVMQAHQDQLQDWIGSYVLPNVLVWRASQDVTIGTDEAGNPIVTHVSLTGWNVLISLPQVASGLFNHPNLRFMIDRNAANAREIGMIVKANVTPTVMQDIRFSPVFAGADYPWGAWQ